MTKVSFRMTTALPSRIHVRETIRIFKLVEIWFRKAHPRLDAPLKVIMCDIFILDGVFGGALIAESHYKKILFELKSLLYAKSLASTAAMRLSSCFNVHHPHKTMTMISKPP